MRCTAAAGWSEVKGQQILRKGRKRTLQGDAAPKGFNNAIETTMRTVGEQDQVCFNDVSVSIFILGVLL